MKRLILIAAALFWAATCLAAEPEVRATVDRSEVAPGESLRLTVEISGAQGAVNVSGIRDFEVVSRGTSQNISIVNGQMSKRVNYTYTLMPKKTGRLLIPPLPVDIDGRTLYTEMLAIQVARDGGEQNAGRSSDLFARMSLSEKQVCLGQQFIARLRIYNAVPVTGRAFQKAPVFEGFAVEQLEENRTYTTTISGRRYEVVEVVYVLTPEKTGTLAAGPATIECQVVRRDRSAGRSPFDAFFNPVQPVSKLVRAEAAEVTVVPLPKFSGPGRFSGLVGTFDLQVDIDETALTVGGSANLTMTVKGQGNIRDATLPQLALPEEAFKIYQEDPVEEVAVSAAGISGHKRFSAALVPLRQGEYQLGPFSLTYFDVEREQYVTVQSEPLAVTVAPASKESEVNLFAAGKQEGKAETSNIRKESVRFTGKDLFPLKKDLSAIADRPPVSVTQYLLLIGLPGIFYLVALAVAVYARKDESVARVMARQSRTALKTARRLGVNAGGDYLDSLYRAIVYAVYSRAGRQGQTLTYREARTLLEEKGCSEAFIEEVCAFLEAVEQARYGGQSGDASAAEILMRTAGDLVRRLTR